jgi:hypothetical protein
MEATAIRAVSTTSNVDWLDIARELGRASRRERQG